MHHLSLLSRRKTPITEWSEGCQDLLEFFALLRIKPHAPPLVRSPSIPLSFILANVLPGGILAADRRHRSHMAPTPVFIVYGEGLPGYLILFAPPRFRASVSVTVQQAAFATGVPPIIYAFHRYTRIPPASPVL